MKIFCLYIVVLSGLLLSSCAGGFWSRPASDPSQKPVISTPTDASTILSCLTDHQKLTHGEFKAAHKTASAQATDGTDAATLHLICLALHDHASFKQLKSGETTLANYIKEHPNADGDGLLGIQVLMQRLEKELASKWTQCNKNLDERIDVLEKGAGQDQKRIRELQKQIEQLKNIENIIKDRER